MLRSLELPLEQIREFLQEGEPGAQRALLEKHRQDIEARARNYRFIATSIESLINGREGIMEKNEIKELAEQPVLGFRFRTDMSKIGEKIQKAYGTLFAHLGRLGEFPAGHPFALYHDAEYRKENMDVVACVQTAKLLEGGEGVEATVLEGGRAASTLQMGPYDEISEAYRELMTWISDNGYHLRLPAGRSASWARTRRRNQLGTAPR